jgi:cell division inhibitor SepF
MAFRDSWHRALVYFGLAEERPFVDEFELERQRSREAELARERERERDTRMRPAPEPEAEIEDRYRERPNVRRLSARRRQRDDFDDIFADDEPRGSRPTTVLRPVERRNGDVRVHLVIPKSFNDAQQVADRFKQAIPVVLNLQSTDNDLAKRLIDFASGLTYALDGGMQRIAHKVFMLTPRNVQISAEERAELIEKGFFNQS